MYFLFPNLKAEEGTAGLQEELELPEAETELVDVSVAQGRESCGEFHIDMVAWGSYPDTPCMDDLPTWTVKNGHIQGEM